MGRALDASNHSGPLSERAAAGLVADGYRLFYPQAVDPPRPYPVTQTRQQIEVGLRYFAQVQPYVWLWFGLGRPDIERKLDLFEPWRLNPIWFVWLDIEDVETVGPTTNAWEIERRVQIVWDAIRAIEARGYKVGLYTARWYWQPYVGDRTDFAGFPLWTAQYDGIDDVDVFWPFGGWTRAQVKQFVGDVWYWMEDGRVDLSVYREDAAPAIVTPPPPEIVIPTIEEQAIIQKPFETAPAPPPMSPKLFRNDRHELALMKALYGMDDHSLIPLAGTEDRYRYLADIPRRAID